MMKASFLVLLGTLGCAGPAHQIRHTHAHTTAIVHTRAAQFLNKLTPEQQTQAVAAYESPYRNRGFCYVLAHCKNDPAGIRISALTATQKHDLHMFLARLLSDAGYYKAMSIMHREMLLQEMEDAHRAAPQTITLTGSPAMPTWAPPKTRDHEAYYVAFFGDPRTDQHWAVRFEGHHLTVNVTWDHDHTQVSVSPVFFGASPVAIPEAPKAGYPLWRATEGQQLLRRELFLAQEILQSFTDAQRSQSLWPTMPGAELQGGTTMPLKAAMLHAEVPGVPSSEMSEIGKHLLKALTQSMADHVDTHIAPIQKMGHVNWRVWWRGDINTDDGEFYFRAVGDDRYLLEILLAGNFSVNSEHAANHVHIAFRDLTHDWDADVLGEHLHVHH